jgi:stage II sporulation protein D
MKRLAVAVVLIAACATTPPRPQQPSIPATQPPAAESTAATRSPNALTPIATVTKSIAEPRIKVGMLSDQTAVTFPRVAGGYYLITESGAAGFNPPSSTAGGLKPAASLTAWTLRRGFTVTAPLSAATPRWAVQVSAISDETSANQLAEKLRAENAGMRVDIIFDPAAGVRRVIAGDFAAQLEANPLREQLTARGYGKDMLVVRRPTDQPFEKKQQLVDDEGDTATIAAESVLVLPVESETIVIDKLPYRTAARVFVNSRGLFNVVNELNLEDYLRGVVPAELGPRIYDEVEALKAQAVAARTYAVRNLGQFRTEGYDICPGPACQAYKGFSGEEPLSDQAVKETAGLIATFEGKPIDALYTSTCGGETSDVGVMFPGRSEPYLKAARCVEMEMKTIAGRADGAAMLTEAQVNGRIFAAVAGLPDAGASWAARDVEQAVTAATTMLKFDARNAMAPGEASRPFGVSVPSQPQSIPLHATSSRRGDVLTYLASVFGFDRYASVVTLPEDRKYFFPKSADPEGTAYRAATFLIKFGFIPTQDIDRIDLQAAMPRDELYSLLGSWLRKHNAMTEVTGKIQTVDGRDVALKAEGKVAHYTLPANIPIFRRLGDRFQEYASVPVMIGDRAFLYADPKKTPVAMMVKANYDGASFDRTSSFANWTRSFRADELVASINRRVAIKQLAGLRPLAVDKSQRVAEMEVTAEGGRTFVLKGLPVRWSLNVPDNLFVFEKSVDPDGMDRYTFYGKGWGHGIGLCQVGAYGMAFRGYTFEQILKRYYAGITIEPYVGRASARLEGQ